MQKIMVLILALCLLPALGAAQEPTNLTLTGIEVRPVFVSHMINFRDEQITSSLRRNRLEISGVVVSSNLFRLKYSVISGFALSETVTPVGIVHVGNTEFGQKEQTGQQEKRKPIDIEWSFQGTHRLEFSGLIKFPVQPMVLVQYSSLTVTATGEKDGKTVTDSVTLNRSFVAFGGLLSYEDRFTRTEVIMVASPQYSRFEVSARCRMIKNFSVSGGYFTETKWLGDQVKERDHGPFLSLIALF